LYNLTQHWADKVFDGNVSLCEMDSDGDGKTNGEELGDPDCVWIRGQSPPICSNKKKYSFLFEKLHSMIYKQEQNTKKFRNYYCLPRNN